MKKIVIFILLASCSMIIFAFLPSKTCYEELFQKNCDALEPYTFIKSFPIEINKQGQKFEYSYVFSKDSEYRVVIGDTKEVGKRMIVNFYDRNKKFVASNYVKQSKKFYSSINYLCTATGVYYVEASYEGDKPGCGVNILGFKKAHH